MPKSEVSSPSKRDEILDAAERMIRMGGYNGFSTRDIAAAVGIKAASVHYHFPTKAGIGAAVIERYTQRFLEELGDPTNFKGAKKAIAHYVGAFRRALARDGKVCLCGVLGAEIGGLPADVGAGTQIFFEKNLEWLKNALAASGGLSEAKALSRATLMLAALEGALILSKSLGNDVVFERIGEGLLKMVLD